MVGITVTLASCTVKGRCKPMRNDIKQQAENLDFSGFTDAEIMEHFNYRCQVDGSTWEVALHHIIFKSQGGHNGPRIPLCNHCHTKLHADPVFRRKHEVKLFRVALVFYELQTQGVLF